MSSSLQPLSQSEKLLLQNLLARARIADDDAEVVTPSSFALVEEDAQSITDASKRRMVDPPESLGDRSPYVASRKDESLAYTPKGKPVCFPPGVDSMVAWGRSIIQFGKFMSKKDGPEFSYKEIYDSEKTEDVRYVRWVKGQVDSAAGHLLDFAQYILVRDIQRDPSGQMPVIPGTSTVCRIK